jgi:hemolysin III
MGSLQHHKGQKAIRDLAKTMVDKAGNVPSLPGVFPNRAAPVARVTQGRRGPRNCPNSGLRLGWAITTGYRMTHDPSLGRLYSRNEVWMDAAIHVLGIVFAINASLWLLAHVTGLSVVVSVSIYCAGLVAMVLASAAYQLWRHGPAKEFLRRIDHAAIFLMIAATYTPFAANRLSAGTGAGLLTAIWLCATAGVILKLMFPRRFERLSILFYLGMGWMILAVSGPLSAALASVDVWLLAGGGIVYSVGVLFFLAERLPFHKPIWHAFVLVAVILHFAAIAGEFAS